MKNFKKILCLAIAMIIASSLAVVPAMAKNHYTVGTTSDSLKIVKEVLFYEDFNAKQSGAVAINDTMGTNNLVVHGATGASVAGSGEDKYLVVTGNSSTKGAFSIKDPTGTVFTGVYTTEFKMMVPEIDGFSSTFFTHRAAINASLRDFRGARMTLKTDGNSEMKFHSFKGTTETKLNDTVVKQGVWYNVKVITDFTNNTYTVYINGMNIANDWAFHATNDGKNTNMMEAFRTENVIGTVYYDDIVMYREPTGRMTYSAEDFSGYSADRDWTSFENTAFVGATNMPTSYNPDAVDMWDTWLEGILYSPVKQNAYGKIDAANDRLVLGGHSEKQSVVLLDKYRKNDGKSEKMAVGFTFTPSDGDGYYDSFYQMRDNYGTNPGVRLQLSSNMFIADTGSGPVRLMSGVEDNKAYNFVIASDSTTATYSVYIDGVCVGNNLAFKFANGQTSYNNHGRPFEVNLANSAPVCYYDDLVIYTDAREDVMATAMATAKTNAAAVSTGAATFALPASTTDGYTVAWASNNEAIAINNGTATVVYPEKAQKVTLAATVKDTNNEYVIERKFVVNVPSKYDVSLTENDGVVTGTVTVNASSFEGYNDGWALLAAYKGNQMVSAKKVNVINGTGTVELDKITEAGSYSARLFVWKENILKPIINNIAPIDFVIE